MNSKIARIKTVLYIPLYKKMYYASKFYLEVNCAFFYDYGHYEFHARENQSKLYLTTAL